MSATTLTRSRPLPPGPVGLEAFRVFARAGRAPLEAFRSLWQQHGDIVRIGMPGPLAQTLVAHPEAAEHVLARNHKNYRKGIVNAQFRVLDGNGLVTSEGEFWVRQRRLAQPAFHRQRLVGLGRIMTDAAEGLVGRWRGRARAREPFDAEPDMMHLTLEIAGKALFSYNLRETAEISQAVDVARDHITWRMYHPFAPEWLPTPGNYRFRQARARLDRLVYGIISERRRSATDRGDLLSMLLQAQDEESGERMSDLQLRDEVMTMLMAGHESTAVSMAWVWHLLARHPEVQERLHAELDAVPGCHTVTPDDLHRLPYLRAVVDETLRLYPTAWALSRQAIGEDELLGRRLPAGGYVTLVLYFLHRHPEFWENPEQFDPDRFMPERAASRPKFAYLPFGGGPRGCIGLHFALMEAQLVLATVAQRFRIEAAPGAREELEPLLSLRNRNGVRILLRERQ